VTLTPLTDGFPDSACWTNVVNGATARATFLFQPTPDDAGSNYTVALVSTVGGSAFTNYWYVYVPTPDEQQIAISEVFANPTTDSASRAFNPLQRDVDTNNVAVNDQYIELANISSSDFDLLNCTIGNGTTVLHQFYYGENEGNEELSPYNSYVVFGGPTNGDDSPPGILGRAPDEPADPGPLGLSTAGGVLALYNGNGYLVDRVAYPACNLNCSLSRFPTINDALVPQAYVSTNYVTPGKQYDGDQWYDPAQLPMGLSNTAIIPGSPLTLAFTIGDTNQTVTLWQANTLADRFNVSSGQTSTNTSGLFNVTNLLPSSQFYFITTQSNYVYIGGT
jgi:hypothetical protein